jgi:phosphopantothenoylcysteine decarboxylase/phosphopantothenate--cysteine ligase
MSSGQCDNLLLAVYLSMRKQTIVAPAMDLDMYLHPTTVRNLEKIQQDGCQVIPAATGELASGLSGQGRMEEPERIVELLEQYFLSKEVDKTLLGKTVLITAGPTYEPLDPVRFIGNRSSGKMGFALARACLQRGACVTLVTGPTHQVLNHASLQTLHVSTAQDMFEVIQKYWSKADIGIFASAVSDYRPVSQQLEKIKKHDAALQIDLVKNPDILFWAGSTKSTEQVLVGFALESENVVNNAREKLVKKHLDLIVMNSIRDEGAGFDVDTNRISLLDKNNNLTTFELKSKPDVAVDIVNYLVENLL